MKAFAYDSAHAIEDFALELRDVPDPVIGPKDLLVAVKAFALNPVDTKLRKVRGGSDAGPAILGWDAAGVVEAVGADVSGFASGDEVYYAGDVTRAGSYATKQAVDYRIVARKPASLDFADAAALPLTALTAHEAMLERGLTYGADSQVLVVGGAGGVGSLAIQLLKALTPATVIATATRPETVAWTKDMGADHVIGRALGDELARIGISGLHAIFITTSTGDYWDAVPGLLRPFGHLMVIDEPATMDMKPFKQKALTVHWEYMFAKAMFGFQPEEQGAMLAELAGLVDAGKVRTTRTQTLPATVENLRVGHAALEGGTAIGKIVMSWT